MARTTAGKCHGCRVAFEWRGLPLHRDAYCPRCGEKLVRTSSHLRKYPWVTDEHPVQRVKESIR